jgi:hypothetical protein
MIEPQEQGGDEVAVDSTLELDLGAVEDSVESYLTYQSATSRQQLVTALARLDEQIGRSDAYEGSSSARGPSVRPRKDRSSAKPAVSRRPSRCPKPNCEPRWAW